MHKGKKGKKFGRERDQRAALFKSLARALIMHGKIMTTETKAKELAKYVAFCVTRSKVNTLSNRRLLGRVFDGPVIKKLFSEIGPRYEARHGGYTRVMKRVPRSTDSARMAVIEFV